MITRAIGLEPAVAVDLETIDLRAGDRVLFCSDGLTDMLREPEIGDILRDERDPDAAAQRLVDAANAAGGSDNITVLLIDIEDDGSEDADVPEPPVDADAADETPAPTGSDDVTEPVPVVVGDDEPEQERRGFFRRKKK